MAKDLYRTIKSMASEVSDAIVMFSTGQDSCVMLDLCVKYIPNVKPVFLYNFPGLSFNERIISWYEKRYGITIEQEPHYDIHNMALKGLYGGPRTEGKRLSFNDMELYLRRKYDLSYVAYGYRKSESLQRRGQLTACDGFDRKFRRLFPLADWSEKDVVNYLKKERLPVNEFYKYGYRDINFPSGEVLHIIKQNYPDDYNKIKAVYPLIEADLYRDYEEN